MARIPKTVFISYRRTNVAHAIKIYQLLVEAGYDPFLDIKDMGSGAWRVIIQREIERRAHFMLLLTPSAVERFTEPNDVMRFEIETALENKRNLVPLMFEGFTYSDPRIRNYLTGKLAILSEYNAYPINWRRLKKDIQDLTARFMSVHPDDVIHPDMEADTRRETSVNRSRDAFGGIPPEEEADAILISPDVGSSDGEMPDWFAKDDDMDLPDMDELLMPEAEEAIDDVLVVEKDKKEEQKLSEAPFQQPTAPLYPPQPASKKSGGSVIINVLLSAMAFPVWATGRVYVTIRDLFNPRPSTTGAIPQERQSAEPPLAPKPAPAPVVRPAQSPAPVPPPQSAPGGASSQFDMSEAELLLMMRQAIANLPPISDEELASEEAEELG